MQKSIQRKPVRIAIATRQSQAGRSIAMRQGLLLATATALYVRSMLKLNPSPTNPLTPCVVN